MLMLQLMSRWMTQHELSRGLECYKGGYRSCVIHAWSSYARDYEARQYGVRAMVSMTTREKGAENEKSAERFALITSIVVIDVLEAAPRWK